MESDRWPPAPDCDRCNAYRSTELIKPLDDGTFVCHCRSCNHVFRCDRFGQAIDRAECTGRHARSIACDVNHVPMTDP